MMELSDELRYRGLINDVASPQLEEKLNSRGLTFYIGTDPTGSSLYIGHYPSLLCVERSEKHGHHPIMLIGNATGLIGDPRVSDERNMPAKEVSGHNYQCLSRQTEALLGSEMVNNLDWTKNISVIDFLQDYGKYFNVNYMISKGTAKRRLDAGIGYTEFPYMILQTLDFLCLYEDRGYALQLGEQDQWGNITSGLELIRKEHGADVECYGPTMPLIAKADGTKFGKSESGTVWLDKCKTGAYEMCQFLVNSENKEVIDHLKKLISLSREETDALEEKVKAEPRSRGAQKALAKEVVTFLHGKEEYNKTLKIIDALSEGNIRELDIGELQDALKGSEAAEVADEPILTDILAQAGIVNSKRKVGEWINQGSIQVNGDKAKSVEFVVSFKNAISEGRAPIKKEKRNYFTILQK